MPSIADEIADLAQMEVDIRELRAERDETVFRVHGELTTAIYNMAKNGEVDLTKLFGSKQERYALGKKLRVLIGYKYEVTPKGVERGYPPECMAGTDRLSTTIRTIASVTLQKCARVALYLLENNFEPSVVRSPNFSFVTHMAKDKAAAKAKPRYDTRN